MANRRAEAINFFSLILLILFISQSLLQQSNAVTPATINTKKALNIGIGVGLFPPSDPPGYGECQDCPQPPEPEPNPSAPPPEPECPPPPPPPEPECPTLSPPPPKYPPPPPPSPPPPRKYPPPPPKYPPPPPPSPPPPSPPPVSRIIEDAIEVIQTFKRTITYDRLGITKTWRGNGLCRDNSTYIGFICDTTIADNEVRVALVNFNGNDFDGRPLALTNFLDGLPDLIAFHSNSNNFTGQVPVGPSKIPSLFELDLSNNELKGEFPRTILTARSLTFLDLRFNKLTGKIPPETFMLDLDVLYLNNNQFTGYIPDNFGLTPALYLTLANNQLTGSIPKSIGLSSNTLREALLLNNQFSGCLPYEIGLLKKATLFDVSINKLTGPIPRSFGCLQNMQFLNLAQNKFYGEVPESVCRLRDLQQLTLNSNYFTQVGPECRKLIKSGVIELSMNCILDLPSQRSAKECEEFFLKKQNCPNPGSMDIVPCKNGYYSRKKLTAAMVEPPRTYAVLQQNHRHR